MGLVGRISRLSRLLERRIEEVFSAHGLQGGRFDVLAALVRAGEPNRLTPTQLYNSLLVSSGTITNRIDRLVDAADAVEAVDRSLPVLVLIDLAVDGDWATVIRRCKLRPHTRQIPIYAFGSHVDAATLRAAREAGADHAWARSRMMKELADVVSRYVNPPIRYPEGWDDVLSDAAKAGIAEFNRGEYFEQHWDPNNRSR